MDLVIKNGFVVDGSGNPWWKGYIGVEEGKIVELGRRLPPSASQTIDATGLVVCPGFIDQHCHADWTLVMDPLADSLLRQGVSTIIVGNCGLSAAPFVEEREENYRSQIVFPETLKEEVPLKWQGTAQYLSYLERVGLSHNVGTHVGHSTLRVAAMDNSNAKPSQDELEEMKDLAAAAMKEGAFGISTGLNFPPGSASTTSELTELAKVIAKHEGIYATHHRNYGPAEREAIEEALEVGEKAGISVHFPHYAATRKANVSQDEVLSYVEKARMKGMQVTFDWCRSYRFSIVNYYDLLRQWLEKPYWLNTGEARKVVERLKDPRARREAVNLLKSVPTSIAFEHTYLLSSKSHPGFAMKTFKEISETMKLDPYEVVLQLMLDEGPEYAVMGIGGDHYSEEDNERLLKHPLCMVEADRPTFRKEGVLKKHMEAYICPKPFGLFPRTIRLYVVEKKVLTLEEAIRKMTSFPAQTVGLMDRGLLREGNWADILVFAPERFKDNATYTNPHQYSEGVEYLLVNGKVVIERDRPTGMMPGRTLRHNTTILSRLT